MTGLCINLDLVCVPIYTIEICFKQETFEIYFNSSQRSKIIVIQEYILDFTYVIFGVCQ